MVAKSWTQLRDQHNLIELSQCSEGNSPPKLDYEWKDTIKQDRKMKNALPLQSCDHMFQNLLACLLEMQTPKPLSPLLKQTFQDKN